MAIKFRSVTKVMTGQPTTDGAGVRLIRAFGNVDHHTLDPFLLLDHFGSNDPKDFMAGFPLHPHRGIETVTYMLEGTIDHEDSIGNRGSVHAGDVQWMSAGSGILHQEMPRAGSGTLNGFQLWVNLPRKNKMMPPGYQGIKGTDIEKVEIGTSSYVKVIAGRYRGTMGPVKDLVIPVELFDVTLAAGEQFDHPFDHDHNIFAYVYQGQAMFGPKNGRTVEVEQTAILGKGDAVAAIAGPKGTRFLIASGLPLNEPLAWGGPIVMNTQTELERAFKELDDGTFIKR
jgi:redox-sensitive bicupin YhaK (pirin superfamily)